MFMLNTGRVAFAALIMSGCLSFSASAQESDGDLDFLLADDTAPTNSGGAADESQNRDQDAATGSRGDAAEAAERTSSDSANEEPLPVIALDEEPRDADALRRPRSRLVEEIIVTAQKREENLQDVPISVQAFSAEQLEVRGVLDNLDLPKIVPGLTITQQVNYTTTYLRGVGSDAFLLADPSVVNYIDGVIQPFPLTLVQDFGAVERVEVLKGPQGTLFGRNAIGGTVNVITKNPSTENFEISAQSVFGTYEQTRNRLHINVPVADWLAFGVSGVFNRQEPHHDGRDSVRPDNPGGDSLAHEKSVAGRGKLRIVPTDWLDINLTYYRVDIEGTGTSFAVNSEPSLIGQLAGVQPQDPYNGENNEAVFTDNINESFYGDIKVATPWFDIEALGSDQQIVSFQNVDFDGSPQPLVLFELDPGIADVQTAELKVLSNDQSWGANWLEWIAGAYYFKSVQGLSGFLSAATTNLDRNLLLGIELPELVPAALVSLLGNAPIPTGTLDAVGLIGTESVSVFSQVTVNVTNWLSLTGGVRWQNEERVLIESSAGLRTLGGQVIPIPGQNFSGRDDPDFRDTTRSIDPKVTIELRPGWESIGREALLYASWQTATKSSTFNSINFTDEPEFVRPEEMTAWEVGAKLQPLGVLNLNLAAFDYTIKDQQVQFISIFEGGIATFENAASARIRGVEIETTALVLPSRWEGLVFNAAYAFLDSEYPSFPNGSGFNEETGLLTRNNDFSGNEVVRTPEWSGTVGLTQTFELPGLGGALELGLSHYYNSGFFYLAQNTSNVREDAYQLLDARLTYIHRPWNLRVSVFGNNLLDEKYNLSRIPTDFGTSDAVAPQRVIGLRLNWDYSS